MVRVSVVIPTYNRANYICETIDSVLAQVYKDYEVIIVDDGSTDNTGKLLKRYGNKIKYFFQYNQGQAAAWNFGIGQSKGEYIALLDDDDLWLPDKLEKQVKFLDENPQFGLVCSEAHAFNVAGKIIKHFKKKRSENFAGIFEGNFIINSTVLIRKECFDAIGGFDQKLRTTQDYDLWLRLAKTYEFHYMDIPFVKYRLHAKSLHNRLNQKLKDHLYIFSKEEIVGHLNPAEKRIKIAREYYDFAPDFVRQGRYGNAGLCCLKAILTYPWVGRFYSSTRKLWNFTPGRIAKVYLKSIYYFSRAMVTH